MTLVTRVSGGGGDVSRTEGEHKITVTFYEYTSSTLGLY